MSRNQWLILAGLALAIYFWLRTPSVEANRTALQRELTLAEVNAQNTANILAQNAALDGPTGYYDANALGFKSPFAPDSDLAGATLYVDIRPESLQVDPRNMPAGSDGYYSDFH